MHNQLQNKKVDIVIPTFNRPDFLKRTLDYYQPYGNDFDFIIADSSNRKNKSKNRQLIKEYPNLNILYLDKFSPSLQQHLKFVEMVKYIKAEYCVFCADDDFTLPSAIKDCVEFLRKNPDYAAAHGSYIGYHVFKTIWGSKKFSWKYRHFHETLSSSDPLVRLKTHLAEYTQMTWTVRKTSVVKKSYAEFSKAKIEPFMLPEYGEIFPDVLTVIQGKVKRLNIFFSARQYFGSLSSYYPSLLEAKRIGIYDREYAKLKKSVLKNLNLSTKTSVVHASLILDDAMETYINYSYQEHLTNKINLILRKFPKVIQQAVRLAHAFYLFNKDKNGRIGKIDNQNSKYYSDFQIIKQAVIQK